MVHVWYSIKQSPFDDIGANAVPKKQWIRNGNIRRDGGIQLSTMRNSCHPRSGVVKCSVVKCSVVKCSVVQCSIVQCSVVQCSVVQRGIVQYSILQCSVVQRSVVYSIELYSIVQYSIVLYRIVQCIELYSVEVQRDQRRVQIIAVGQRVLL